MKKYFLLSSILVFMLVACAEKNSPAEADETTTTVTETAAGETAETTTIPETTMFSSGFSPLELLGYQITDVDLLLIKYPNKNQTYEPDTFRKYFFGTWKAEIGYSDWAAGDVMIVDDSEKCNTIMATPTVNWVNGHVLAVAFTNGGLGDTYWLDTNNPGKMYRLCEISGYDDEYDAAGRVNSPPYFGVFVKTDAPVNRPENGFLSSLRLAEITKEHGIDPLLFTDINIADDGGLWLHRDGYIFGAAIYLVSEETDKIVFKTSAYGEYNEILDDGSSFTTASGEIDAVVTLKKTGGEWERSVEFDREQLEQLRAAAERERQ